MRSGTSCARTNRWWLLLAESTRCPRISFGDHFPDAGRRALSASERASSRPALLSRIVRSRAIVSFIPPPEAPFHYGAAGDPLQGLPSSRKSVRMGGEVLRMGGDF